MTTSRTDDLLAILEGSYEDSIRSGEALAQVINGLGAQAYLALCRFEGRPREADREMWRALRDQASPELLIDMVVFDKDHAWSMRAEDKGATC